MPAPAVFVTVIQLTNWGHRFFRSAARDLRLAADVDGNRVTLRWIFGKNRYRN